MENVRAMGTVMVMQYARYNESSWLTNHEDSLYYMCQRLLLWHYKAVEITANEVTHNKTGIEHQDVHKMFTGVCQRSRQIVERIGKTVRKTTVDEERHAKEQCQRLSFAGKSNNCCHNKTAAYCQQTGLYRTEGKT